MSSASLSDVVRRVDGQFQCPCGLRRPSKFNVERHAKTCMLRGLLSRPSLDSITAPERRELDEIRSTAVAQIATVDYIQRAASGDASPPSEVEHTTQHLLSLLAAVSSRVECLEEAHELFKREKRVLVEKVESLSAQVQRFSSSSSSNNNSNSNNSNNNSSTNDSNNDYSSNTYNITIHMTPFEVVRPDGRVDMCPFPVPMSASEVEPLLTSPVEAVPGFVRHQYFTGSANPSIRIPNKNKPEIDVLRKEDDSLRWHRHADKMEVASRIASEAMHHLNARYNATANSGYFGSMKRQRLDEPYPEKTPAFKKMAKGVVSVITDSTRE